MDRPKDGPAFPVTWSDGDGQMVATPGMTLRDWFAGQALAGYCASEVASGQVPGREMEKDAFARWAYLQADAMLAAREADRG